MFQWMRETVSDNVFFKHARLNSCGSHFLHPDNQFSYVPLVHADVRWWRRGPAWLCVIGVVRAKNGIYIKSMAKNRRRTFWVCIFIFFVSYTVYICVCVCIYIYMYYLCILSWLTINVDSAIHGVKRAWTIHTWLYILLYDLKSCRRW